jgi:hypothetical protein
VSFGTAKVEKKKFKPNPKAKKIKKKLKFYK